MDRFESKQLQANTTNTNTKKQNSYRKQTESTSMSKTEKYSVERRAYKEGKEK